MGSCGFPLSSISPALDTNPTYTTYQSSPTGIRGFCKICGSSLTFQRPGQDSLEILFGAVDEEILKSETGTQLCGGKEHIWLGNAVRGVSDGTGLKGTLWVEDRGGEKVGVNA